MGWNKILDGKIFQVDVGYEGRVIAREGTSALKWRVGVSEKNPSGTGTWESLSNAPFAPHGS
jgi:hypothetical protein